ncbi:FtsX-like permease family protein [Halomicrobium salinisoli]|uniref:FtsX-like permease family protein n=1 Tax=Halomicrobium salinisoli TaxID=2878391 RepID=UPI001CF0C644|nr:FtsX-like permease family protein [Halomicrobium salinisoli]
MSYRRALLARWSRRDVLAVVVVALAIAFLTGTVLLVVTAGDRTTAVAAGYDAGSTVATHGSVAAAEAAAGDGAAVVPFATVESPDGERRYVLDRRGAGAAGLLPGGGSDADGGGGATVATLATADERAPVELRGSAGTVEATVTPRAGRGPVPPEWYVAPSDAVAELGPTGAFVVRDAPEGTLPHDGVPLRAALAFFAFGTGEALGALAVVAGGSALLVAVVVYSVTRMTVRDRRAAIRVVRSTGAPPRTVLGLFAARAGLLVVAGVALGYAVGVVAVNAAVNVAVFAGLPTSLAPRVTPTVAGVVAAGGGAAALIGAVSGGLAAWPAARCDPADVGAERRRDGRLAARLSILDARALVPTAATLTAFVAFVVLVAGVAGVVGPLTAGGATVSEPGAVHPIASSVPATYATALRDRGIDASPEILLFEARDGQPYAARGANYSAFASVTDTELVDGRAPNGSDEAVVGRDLAATLDLGTGDSLTMGGSTDAGLHRVRVVGVFAAPGPYDDQALVPLPVARHLANRASGQVHFVRADRLPEGDPFDQRGAVADLSVPSPVPPNGSVPVEVTVRNAEGDERSIPVAVALGNQSIEESVSVPGGDERTVTVEFAAPPPGRYEVRAGDLNRTVTVAPRDAVRLGPLPERAPPNATLRVRVRTPYGDPVPNATVAVGNRSVRTGADGGAWIEPGGPGERRIEVRAGDRTASREITVAADATRRLPLTAEVRPDRPDALTRPTVRLRATNPWNRTVERRYEVAGPGGSSERTVTAAPGANRTAEVSLARQPPGSYDVTVRSSAGTTREFSYRVTGDDRLASALASGGASGQSGIGQAVEAAFGNLRLVVAVVLGLATLMTVGGTTASFARAVHARRRTIGVYRATGASPVRVAALVFRDALVVGALGTAIAIPAGLLALRALARADYLTVFGVRLSTTPSPALLAGVVLGALAVTALGAGLATAALLRVDPYRLFATGPDVRDERPEGGEP